ncbi:L-2-hydroxyglutarate oxidase [Glutamicibacter sp.]|uniref:L-2-hydroxyglutarate oxidase n=1 Tax=Glutamicibacter sp. TaxID=1931995 RepID=UPI0028BD7DDA|nr:L-2-hydroxyglutarate oxidase [Glutamicibacter sp.]
MLQAKSFAVIGAGIIGAAVARELSRRYPGAQITILDKETKVAAHQTGHNSGVVHAGLYYEPGGLKARLCRRGVELITGIVAEKNIPYERCGKLVVALDPAEESRLHAIFERAQDNEVPGVELLGPEGIKSLEPNAVGKLALNSPSTAIIDYSALTLALIDDVVQAGGELRLGCTVQRIQELGSTVIVHTSTGAIQADHVVVCAGVQSDRLARSSGADAQPSVVPFFGQYFQLEEGYRSILNGLVYPVPDPKYPFLGVHLTKRVDGQMMVGPNAFLSLSRENYRGLGLNPRDLGEVLANPGFWKFAAKNAPAALREVRSVASKQFFLKQAAAYVPSLEGAKATRLTRGIRAQAMDRSGGLLDDFAIDYRPRTTHIRNAPSPGATSSMAIAEYIVDALASGAGRN